MPEIWRYDGRRLYICQLAGDSYGQAEHSEAFPWLTGSVLTDLLDKSKTLKRAAPLRSFREIIREQQARR